MAEEAITIVLADDHPVVRSGLKMLLEAEDEHPRHRAYTREHGEDSPDVRDWTWSAKPAAGDEPGHGIPG